MKNEPGKTQPQYLSGWKEIATYLGKAVRTVQRYERQMGLPVRRPAGKSRAAVLATRKEIDAWVSASPIGQSFQLRPPHELPEATAKAIQQGLATMKELRDQMQDLRLEVGMSVDLLRKSVHQLRGGLAPEQWWETLPPLGGRRDRGHESRKEAT